MSKDSPKFGSLSRPVTITISGPLGSGKMALAAHLANMLTSYGADISFFFRRIFTQIS